MENEQEKYVNVKNYMPVSHEVVGGELVRDIQFKTVDMKTGINQTTTRRERIPEFLPVNYEMGTLLGLFFVQGTIAYDNNNGKGKYVRIEATHYNKERTIEKIVKDFAERYQVAAETVLHPDSTRSLHIYDGMWATFLWGLMDMGKGRRVGYVNEIDAVSDAEFAKGMVAGMVIGCSYKTTATKEYLHVIGEERVNYVERWINELGLEYWERLTTDYMQYYDIELVPEQLKEQNIIRQ